MAIKKAQFNIKGMSRDLAASKFSPEYAYENKNLRLVATDDNTTLALTNEKGNVAKAISWDRMSNALPPVAEGNYVLGTPIGQQVIGDNLILFTAGETTPTPSITAPDETSIEDLPAPSSSAITVVTDYEDNIYKFWFTTSNTLKGVKLFQGDLGFSKYSPIESIGVYENEELQKVYWTDGINQPRLINVAATAAKIKSWGEDSFNFVRKLNLNESVTISRNLVASGSFAPGVVQYYITYYSLYGQESNIFYTSPLYYVSYNDRGASPEDTVGVSFTIQIANYDKSYDYVRVYCTHRTSINSTPQARKVVDIAIPSSGIIYYTDYGVSGESIDPTKVLYIGGQASIFGTLAQKDDTLFLGNIKTLKKRVTTTYKNRIRNLQNAVSSYRKLVFSGNAPSGYYYYQNLLQYNSQDITSFKAGETYRLGVQFQDATGAWSDPIWLSDYQVSRNAAPIYNDAGECYVTKIQCSIPSMVSDFFLGEGYKRVRPVVVYPTITDRTIVCQGVLCPTVYNAEDRYNDAPTAMSSWFFRPNAPYSVFYDVDLKDSTDGDGSQWTYDGERTPIMSNHKDRYTNPSSGDTSSICSSVPNSGKWAEFRHNKEIPGNLKANAEIQCISNPPQPFLGTVTSAGTGRNYTEKREPEYWVAENKECFYVDQSIVTFHSPDIEFDKEIRSIDSSKLKLRIVGYVPITSHISSIDIQTSTPPLNYSKGHSDSSATQHLEYPDIPPGFYKEKVSHSFTTGTAGGYGWKSALSGAYWLDELYETAAVNSQKRNAGFIVYPWHRSGSLNNTRTVGGSATKTALLSQKKMSILRHSYNTEWLPNSSIWYAEVASDNKRNGISGIAIFDSNEDTIIKLPAPTNSNLNEITYKGNVDKVITFHTQAKDRTIDGDLDILPDPGSHEWSSAPESTSSFYPIVVAKAMYDLSMWEESGNHTAIEAEDHNFKTSESHSLFINPYTKLRDVYYENNTYKVREYSTRTVQASSNDPVSMRYKSTPHAVLALNYTNDRKQAVLPTHNSVNIVGYRKTKPGGSCPDSYSSNPLFWDPNYDNSSKRIVGAYQSSITVDTMLNGYLWIGELYNTVPTAQRFGGDSEEARENNQWLPAGEPISLDNTQDINLLWTEGDTYYQRYDCLKTYPYTKEDQNSIVDILSFMVETRINLDGRYDRNRGQANNLYVSPTNFNLLNLAYSQRDNLFSYRSSNINKLSIDSFPNSIVWTKTKTAGEEVDSWTNITLTSTLDLDGDKGPVRAIRRFNDSLLAFQDEGISQILYNENVQISSADGVPIEIANSGKVSGKRYIVNHIGCTNKWSICSSPNGLYFIDDRTKDIYLYNGKINNLSDKLGFHSWMVRNFADVKIWNPTDFDSGVVYYDRVNQDVLFITKDECLAFNENLEGFSSFYSYEHVPYFSNINDRGITWQKAEGDIRYKPWLHREGEYNMFYNKYQPYWTTVVVNPDPTADKIFNNVEFSADSFDTHTTYLVSNHTFDHLETWNEYQKGRVELTNTQDLPSSLKKKFRVWRANIPRWNVTMNGSSLTSRGFRRDRMRNPWLYLKLSTENENTYKTVLHNLVVDYFE